MWLQATVHSFGNIQGKLNFSLFNYCYIWFRLGFSFPSPLFVAHREYILVNNKNNNVAIEKEAKDQWAPFY